MTVNENNHISFFVPGLPIAQPRAHQSSSGGRIRRFVPSAHPIHGYRLSIQAEFFKLGYGKPWVAPLRLEIEFWMARPKKITYKNKPNVWRPHSVKPDLDNLVKSVADALNGLLYEDDSQVWGVNATKRVCGDCDQTDQVGTRIHAFRFIPDDQRYGGNKQ